MCAESNLCDLADMFANCQLNLFPKCWPLILNPLLNIQTISEPKAEKAASWCLWEQSQPLEKERGGTFRAETLLMLPSAGHCGRVGGGFSMNTLMGGLSDPHKGIIVKISSQGSRDTFIIYRVVAVMLQWRAKNNAVDFYGSPRLFASHLL